MAKATTNGRFARFVSFINEHERLSEEDRKKLLGLIAEDEEPSDERRQQEFENRVVDRVLQELSLKDGKRMLDYLFINLAHRFEQKGHLKRLVGEHLSRRMRVLAGLTTFFAIAFSVVGYTSMTSSAKDAGTTAAIKEFEKMADDFNTKFEKQNDDVEKRVVKFEADFEKRADGLKNDLDERIDSQSKLATERFEGTASNIQSSVERAHGQMTNSLMQFQLFINDEMSRAVKEFSAMKQNATEEIAAGSVKARDDAMANLEGRIALAQVEFSKLVESMRNDLKTEREAWKQQIRTTQQETKPQTDLMALTVNPRSTSAGEPESAISNARINLMVEAIGLAVERKFEFPPMFALATKAAKEGASDIIRSSFSALLDMPSRYKDEQRVSAADLMLAKSIDPQERLHNATECMMAAARADDRAMFDKAQAARKDNFLSRALGRNVFVEVAEAYTTGKNGAEFVKLLDEVDYESLQTRGYLNLYAIAKKAAAKKTDLPEPTLRKRQDELLKQIRGSNFIDRPSDYTSAYFLVDALNAEPFLRDSAIAEVLDLVEKEVFRDDNTEDPWKLKDLIATVRNKLETPPTIP